MSKPINSTAVPHASSSAGKWMALIAAILGWLFDGFEMGMFPLIGKPALAALLGPKSDQAADWFGVIMAVFLVGAATGGVIFGWLGDRIGRVRAMSLSIVTYAIFTGLCGFATEAWHIAVLRFVASLGMGGEWSLGVALVIELWPDRSRTFVAGMIGAASNVGFLLVGILSLRLLQVVGDVQELMRGIGLGETTIDYLTSNQAWRLLMIAGALPALLVFLIRLFVPESERWQHERDKGATSHWATRDLIGVLVGCCGAGSVIFCWTPLVNNSAIRIIGTVMGVAVAFFGYAYPVWCYMRRAEQAGALTVESRATNTRNLLLGALISGIALLGTWGALQWAPRWAAESLQSDPLKHAKEYTQIYSALGAIVGTIAAAYLAGVVGRRMAYSLICVGSFVSALYLYLGNDQFDAKFLFAMFTAGAMTAAFYGFFPLYLPELFPTKVRATSQGFAYNFGRIIAAIGTLQTANLMKLFDGNFPMAGSILSGIYLLGLLAIWFCPETKGKPLPE
ncbi:MAG: MFS transporter [Pirellulales bacterium]|nr:MFS transporter [Pirellulales bacterium]